MVTGNSTTSIKNSEFSENVSLEKGGAISASQSILTLDNVIITSNKLNIN